MSQGRVRAQIMMRMLLLLNKGTRASPVPFGLHMAAVHSITDVVNEASGFQHKDMLLILNIILRQVKDVTQVSVSPS